MEPRSPTLQADSLPAEPQGKPKDIGVAYPFSRGSSQPRNRMGSRNWTRVSCIVGRFFTNGAIREALYSRYNSCVIWLVTLAVTTKYYRLHGLNYRILFSYSYGGWDDQDLLADWISSDFLACRWLPSCVFIGQREKEWIPCVSSYKLLILYWIKA